MHSALILADMLPLDLRIREVASLYEAKRGVCQSWLGDREIERMSPAIEALHPAEYGILEFKSPVDEEQVQGTDSKEVRIFTDGSKSGGRVGAAMTRDCNVFFME